MRIDLYDNQTFPDMGLANEGCPSMDTFLLQSEEPCPAVIVCPGGGYAMRAEHEGRPIAKWLNRIGVSAFVLNYRLSPYHHPIPLEDAQRAIRIVRLKAKEWNVDANRIGILGFSAGGHLAATAATHFDSGHVESEDPLARESSRPDFVVLGYPVITLGEGTDDLTRNLLGDKPDMRLIHALSNETQVTPDTPPAFLWHTADDNIVPVHNVYLFAEALSACQIPYELHVFEKGIHGLGLAEGHREVQSWTSLCERWMKARRIIRAYPVYSEYSTVGELLRNQAAVDALEQYVPGISRHPDFAWMSGFTLKHLASIPESGLSEAMVDAMAEDLSRIDVS